MVEVWCVEVPELALQLLAGTAPVRASSAGWTGSGEAHQGQTARAVTASRGLVPSARQLGWYRGIFRIRIPSLDRGRVFCFR